MKGRWIASEELMLPGEKDPLVEADKHPKVIGFGFTHFSTLTWDTVEQMPVAWLKLDPECPRCKEIMEVKDR